MGWKTLDDFNLEAKRVLIRVDINVPVENGQVSDATRIEKIAPTVREIMKRGGFPVLLAHFGRPKGRVQRDLSLLRLVPVLERVLKCDVIFVADCIGPAVEAASAILGPNQVLLLENTRFYAQEEQNDPTFVAKLAKIGDIFCNDAFSAAHRAHASTEGLARILNACAGRLMEVELKALETALGDPIRPVVAVVGGAKVSTKLKLLGNLVEKVDHLVIGGGMANTFLVAKGINVGTSLAEQGMAAIANDILVKAVRCGCEIILPKDIVIARKFEANAAHEICLADSCPNDAMILDAGPESISQIFRVFEVAKTLIWNGPLGAFELEPFDAATNAAAQKASVLTKEGNLVSVAGGGDTVAALNKAGAAAGFSFVSTAGGAFLEWMEGKQLPGVAALSTA